MENQSTKYGNVQKCPQCGAPVEPMAVKCNTCGYEFRNVEALKSSQQLAAKLDSIAEAYRNKKGGFFNNQHDNQIYSMREQAMVIKSFPIPTTKEDLLDFVITMQSKYNSATGLEKGTGVKTAYKAKYEECINKAKLLFPNDPMFQGVFDNQKKSKGCSLFVLLTIIATSALWVVL